MNRLRELRQKKGDTQEVVAKAMGVTRRGYQKWEKEESQIKSDKAQQLADYFGVSVGYLLGFTDNKKVYDDEKVNIDYDGRIWVYSKERNKDEDFQVFINCLKQLQVLISDDQAKAVFNLIQTMNLNSDGNYWGDFISYDLMFSRTVNEIYNDLAENGFSLLVEEKNEDI
jgi:DNA polymerase III, beta subunit